MEQRYDTTQFILAMRANLEAMNQFSGEVLKNVPEQQRVLEFIDDLSVKIEYSQTLVQRFLNKAVADIGIDSKSTQLLIQAAEKQAEIVDYLKNIQMNNIDEAFALSADLPQAQIWKPLGEIGGNALDIYFIYDNLSKGNYSGSYAAGMGMFLGTLGAMATLAAATALGIAMSPALAIVIGVASVVGAYYGEKAYNDDTMVHDWLVDLLSQGFEKIHLSDKIDTFFVLAQKWVPYVPVDPLALDLDNDGIETTAINGWNGVLFDHNNDGVKTATGWLKGDDGFLVLDRNGNGTIDNGGELFGDNTKLGNGVNATDGFAALADVDTNYDHLIDINDGIFPLLKVWQDLNQDGISQANESVIFYKNRLINFTSLV